MKKILLFIIIVLFNNISFSQTGTVENFTKISATQGNFTGDLNNGDLFGISKTIGDLDGDGYEDLAVTAQHDDDGGTNTGAVWILFLNEDRTVKSHQKISSLEGNFNGDLDSEDSFGCSITAIGDLDNDGVIDIAVGAKYDDDYYNAGAVWILFMNTDGTVKTHQKISATNGGLIGLTENRLFGASTCPLGDLDGDGILDIAVGSPNYDDDGGYYRGCVWILFLNTDGTVKAQQKINDYHGNFNVILDDSDKLGFGLSNIGDINNDGITDIIVCALYDDDGGTNVGAVYILFLETDGTVKSNQKISAIFGGFTGSLNNECRFGSSSVGIGDIDNDGINDIAVSAQKDDDGGTDKGAVWIILLNNDGSVKSHQKISETEGNFNGDLDPGDYFSAYSIFQTGGRELVAGAIYDDDGGTDKGAVWILDLNNDYIIDHLISINSSICLGNSTGDILFSNNSGTITDWEKRLDGGTWQSIGHTGYIYSEIPVIDGTWEYRIEIDNGAAFSNTVSIIVNPVAVAGTASATETEICTDSTTTITLTAYEGNIQWQESENGTVWTDIPGAVSADYTTDALTNNMFFRANVNLGSCPESQSNVIEITVIEAPEAYFLYNTNNQEISFLNNSANSTNYFWNFGDGNTSTFENPVHTYSSSDTYTVTLMAINNVCPDDDYSEDIVVTYVGLSKITSDIIRIIPNPSKDHIIISGKDLSQKNTKFQIYDLSGKLINEDILSSDKINISRIKQGTYIIKIITQSDIYIKKIIKL